MPDFDTQPYAGMAHGPSTQLAISAVGLGSYLRATITANKGSAGAKTAITNFGNDMTVLIFYNTNDPLLTESFLRDRGVAAGLTEPLLTAIVSDTLFLRERANG